MGRVFHEDYNPRQGSQNRALPLEKVKRRNIARRYFLKGHWSVETTRRYYEGWRDDNEFMLGERWDHERVEDGWAVHRERVSWLLPKRGSWLYKQNLKNKFAWIEEMEDKHVFDPSDTTQAQETHFLFVTWTTKTPQVWDNKINRFNSWIQDSKVINRCMQRLRNHYGRVEYYRVNEGTKKGYPAPHAVLFFPDYLWRVFYRKGKWRVVSSEWAKLKGIIEGVDVRAKPVQGFSDIEGIFSPKYALRYVVRYLLHIEDGRKAEIQDYTYFWLWLTGKHTYSTSHDFFPLVQAYLGYIRLDTTLLGISKVTWVSLRVGGARDADEWDAKLRSIHPWAERTSHLFLRYQKLKEKRKEKLKNAQG